MSCFRRQLPLCWSPSSCLRLLSRLLVPFVFLSMRCFRSQLLLTSSFSPSRYFCLSLSIYLVICLFPWGISEGRSLSVGHPVGPYVFFLTFSSLVFLSMRCFRRQFPPCGSYSSCLCLLTHLLVPCLSFNEVYSKTVPPLYQFNNALY